MSALAPRMRFGVSNASGAKFSMKGKSRRYHVEVVVNDRESEDSALKRFRNLTRESKVVYEIRRRQQFENRHDIKDRKDKERGLFKWLDDPETWAEAVSHNEISPFAHMFPDADQKQADIFEGGQNFGFDNVPSYDDI